MSVLYIQSDEKRRKRMKKIFLTFAIVSIFVLSACQQSSNPPVIIIQQPQEETPATTTEPGEQSTPETQGEENPIQRLNASNLVFISQGNETVDSTEYLVKKYAEVFLDDPYFYIYYKVYYLNDKVRRIYSCPHGIGSQRDYKYSDFNEAECRKGHSVSEYYYYENGKKEKYTSVYYDVSGNITQQSTETYYESGNTKTSENLYNNMNMSGFSTYYDIPYDTTIAMGFSVNGGGGLIKLNGSITGNQVSGLYYFYESGYLKYYYSNGYYYEYADNTTRSASTDSSVYTSRTAYTNDQALAKLNELKNY